MRSGIDGGIIEKSRFSRDIARSRCVEGRGGGGEVDWKAGGGTSGMRRRTRAARLQRKRHDPGEPVVGKGSSCKGSFQ